MALFETCSIIYPVTIHSFKCGCPELGDLDAVVVRGGVRRCCKEANDYVSE